MSMLTNGNMKTVGRKHIPIGERFLLSARDRLPPYRWMVAVLHQGLANSKLPDAGGVECPAAVRLINLTCRGGLTRSMKGGWNQ